MKLGEVFQAIGAWRNLSGMKMNPRMAYRILKYVQLVSAEYDIAEKQRVSLIHEITKTADGQDANIEPNTEEFSDYVKRFNEVLETKIDLELFDRTLEDVLAVISKEEKNVLTVQDLGLLELFFKQGNKDNE